MLINKIYDKNIINLYQLFNNEINGLKMFKYIYNNITNKSNYKLDLDYKSIFIKKGYILPYNKTIHIYNKAYNESETILKFLPYIDIIRKYLDINTCTGLLPYYIKKKLKHTSIYGIDIDDKKIIYDKFHYKIYSGINIPFRCTFDLITLILVIHHIKPEIFLKLLNDIINKLNIGGFLIIKENDLNINNPFYIKELINFQHNFFNTNNTNEYLYLYTKDYLEKIILNTKKFKLIKNQHIIRNNITNYYYSIFMRI